MHHQLVGRFGMRYSAPYRAAEVGLHGLDDDRTGDGELFADVAAAAGAFGGVAGGGVDAGEANALAADDFEA